MKIIQDENPYFIELEDLSVAVIQKFLMTELVVKIMLKPYQTLGAKTIAFETLPQIIEWTKTAKKQFYMMSYQENDARRILELVPLARTLSLNPFRTTLFVVPPGFYYSPHKDGRDLKIGLNYPLLIQDDGCITSWFSEDELQHLPMEVLAKTGVTREVQGFDKAVHKSIKSFIMKPDKMVLFNTDIYHNFSNASPHWRIILTLRPIVTSLNFEVGANRVRRLAE